MTKEVRKHSGVSSISDAGKTGQLHAKEPSQNTP